MLDDVSVDHKIFDIILEIQKWRVITLKSYACVVDKF